MSEIMHFNDFQEMYAYLRGNYEVVELPEYKEKEDVRAADTGDKGSEKPKSAPKRKRNNKVQSTEDGSGKEV